MKSDQEWMEFFKTIKWSSWLIGYAIIQVLALGVIAYVNVFGSLSNPEGIVLFHLFTGFCALVVGMFLKDWEDDT